MGYYTKYKLQVEGGDRSLIETLRQENQNAMLAFDDYGETFSEQKWYDYEEDMKSFSKKHPNVLFVLKGVGEENCDIWIAYFKNGLMQYAKVKLVFEDFNENLLSDK